MSVGTDDFITVAEVAVELRLTERQAWERLKAWGVRCTDHRMSRARFRRSEYEARRDEAMKPPPARAPRSRPETGPGASAGPRARDVQAKVKALKGTARP